MIFDEGLFHADPHPGNIFVRKSETENEFSLTFIDFGMMGQITDEVRLNLQRLLFALASRDPRGSLVATQKLNFLLPSADTLVLEQALEKLFERFGGVGVADLLQTDPKEIRDIALEYSQLIRTLPFQLPENFLLLFRSLSLISGVTSSLNKDFNLWDAVDPFARSLLNGTGERFVKNLTTQVSEFASTLIRLTQRIDGLIATAEGGELVVRNTVLEKQVRTLDSSVRRVSAAVIFLGLLGAGIYLRLAGDALGNVLLFVSLLPLVRALGLLRK
jgi:predicted unusual protein kinase regulating ubiquinone biosynthesis (AarF/ABC1/UbiB family)